MTATEQRILDKLEEIERRLDFLIVPVARQMGRQQAQMTPEEERAHNKEIYRAARLRAAGRK